MDRNSEVERDFDEIQRNRDGSIAPLNASLRLFDDEIPRNREGSIAGQNARLRFFNDEIPRNRKGSIAGQNARLSLFDDEMRRVYARVKGEEEMASLLVRGRGADEGLEMRFGGCRGLTLAQLQSLEDRIANRVETRVAAFLNRIADSFEAEMTKAFNTLRTMEMSGERGGYAMVPNDQATTANPHAESKIARLPDDDGKKIIMLTKPEEEGAKGQVISKEFAKRTHEEEWSYCVFCDASFTSKESFEEHRRNLIHDTLDIGPCSPKKRKATNNDVEAVMKKSKPSMVGGGGEVVGCSKSVQGQTSDEQIAAESIVVASQSGESQSKDEKENTYWCQTCSKQMNSRSMMEQHKKGKKHIKLAAAKLDVVVYRSVSDGDA